MNQIFNKKAVKSLFKVPIGQTPPPPPLFITYGGG